MTTSSIGPEFLPKIGQKWLKKYQKMYQRAKMYWYIDTFSIKNVSMCRYWYILKVSDTDTVSDTKGLHADYCTTMKIRANLFDDDDKWWCFHFHGFLFSQMALLGHSAPVY